MKYILFALLLIALNTSAQSPRYSPIGSTRTQDSNLSIANMIINGALRLPLYSNTDASKVASFDASGNVILRSVSGTGTVTSISQGIGIILTPNPLIGAGTAKVDTSFLSGIYARIGSGAVYTNGYGLSLISNIFSADTIKVLSVTHFNNFWSTLGTNAFTSTAYQPLLGYTPLNKADSNIYPGYPTLAYYYAHLPTFTNAVTSVFGRTGAVVAATNDYGYSQISGTIPAVTSITAGTGLSGGVITGIGTISMPNIGTAGTHGSGALIPIITTDAQGRVTTLSDVTSTPPWANITGIPSLVNSINGSSGTLVWSTLSQYGITDAYTKTASDARYLQTISGIAAGGDLAGTYPNPTMATIVAGATVGDATHVPVITYDAKGRITATTTTTIGGGTVTSVGTTSPILGGTITGSGTISIQQGTSTSDGYISHTDWNTFNGKQAAGNYITALTGDGVAAGPGSAALTLAAVGTAGTYGSSTTAVTITTDTKGRVTSVTGSPIPQGTVTSVAAGAGLIGGTWTTSGTVSMPNVGTSGTYGDATHIPGITTDAQGRISGVTTYTIAPGGVTSVSGTANQISSTGGATPVLAIVSSAILPGSPTVATAGTAAGSVATIDGTQKLTNKWQQPRAITTTTISATPTYNTDNQDETDVTAQAVNITSMTTNLSGTAVRGQLWILEMTGIGSLTWAWGTSFENGNKFNLPTTITTTTQGVVLKWNVTDSKWQCDGLY